jgi:hypothetical protein
MKLYDLFESAENTINPHQDDGRYDATEDQQVRKFKDTRKSRLTLEGINKLRRIHEVRQVELKKQNDFLSTIYAAAPAEPGM